MIVQQSVLSLIVQLLKAKSVGEKGLQYLVAWSVFRQLMKYTVPNLLVGRSTKSAACYEHAKKAMRIAVTSPYYQTGALTVFLRCTFEECIADVLDSLQESSLRPYSF